MRRLTLLCAILVLTFVVLADPAQACRLHRGHGRGGNACCACCTPCQTGPMCCPIESAYVGGYIPGDMIPPLPPKAPAPPPAPLLPKAPVPPEPLAPETKPAEKPEPSPADKSAVPMLVPPTAPAEKVPPKAETPATPPVPPQPGMSPAAEKPKVDVPAPPEPKLPASPAPPEKKAEATPKPTASNGPILRVWTDSSGTHRVVARFAGIVDGDTVRLEQLDGAHLRVALDRLSAADQQYVSTQRTTLAAN
jgi:SLA1 homology domain 1, SHD1